MKKLVLLWMALFLVACSTTSKKAETKKMYFVFATPLAEHEIWLKAKEGFYAACKEKDLVCDWIGPTAIDTDKMEEVIETAIAQKADAIITQGVVSDELIKKAKDKGIPIMLVDADLEYSERFAYLGKDFNKQARILLDDIEKKYGKDEFLEIGIQVAERDFTIAVKQIDEINAVFREHRGGFAIKVIGESKSDSMRAKQEWQTMLKNNKINVAINFAGESAIACSEVAEEYHLRDSMLIYGVDDMPNTIKLIKSGAIDGSVVTSFYDYGYLSTIWMYEYLNGKKTITEEINGVDLILVNKENVETYQEELEK